MKIKSILLSTTQKANGVSVSLDVKGNLFLTHTHTDTLCTTTSSGGGFHYKLDTCVGDTPYTYACCMGQTVNSITYGGYKNKQESVF